MDDAMLKFYDVIPGAIISLCIWHYDGWTELVLAAVEGDPSKVVLCFFQYWGRQGTPAFSVRIRIKVSE